MREVAFIRKNAGKWQRFEAMLDDPGTATPDELADLFVQLTDDLAYARSFYPGSKTTEYLNVLSAKVYQAIYRNKKEDRRRFVTFWKHELPLLMYESRKELLVSCLVFALAVSIGALSSAYDATFVRLIMGDTYVNMTLENIESDDPMAVYKQANEVDMFLGITFNNVRVSFIAFAFGLLLSFGTGYVLFINGVMLGAFQYFFYEHGLLAASARTIWIHGTLEISAIVVAGCAGLVMGNSLLFPGTYSRLQSFVRGARRGLKIVVGLVPMFVVAGFLEGFVTRRTGMPVVLSLAVIGGSLAFVLWYFVYYPHQVHRAATRAANPGSS